MKTRRLHAGDVNTAGTENLQEDWWHVAVTIVSFCICLAQAFLLSCAHGLESKFKLQVQEQCRTSRLKASRHKHEGNKNPTSQEGQSVLM